MVRYWINWKVKMIRYLTAGESHGPELTGILEGIPAPARGAAAPRAPATCAAPSRGPRAPF